MASAKVLVFATADEKTQVSQLRKYYSDKGVKIPTEGIIFVQYEFKSYTHLH